MKKLAIAFVALVVIAFAIVLWMNRQREMDLASFEERADKIRLVRPDRFAQSRNGNRPGVAYPTRIGSIIVSHL
ncbi:MAG: hypothetical protein ACLFVU_00910 [Phycisphaerae bacterium]